LDLHWEWNDDSTLRLRFGLPPGTYATVVLAEIGRVSDRSSESHGLH
jgi:tRNA pseudouridine13 synthase